MAKSVQGAVNVPEGGGRPGLPAWEDMPDIELYMDQVIALMARYLGDAPEDGGKALTPAMVNNYVKTGLLPAPERKRYTREHLARLAIVCSLKAVLPLSAVRALLERELATRPVSEFYAEFRELAERAREDARESYAADAAPGLSAALRACAERDLAVSSYRP